MKTYTLLAALLLYIANPIKEVTDRLGVKGPLKFDQTSFVLASAEKPTNNYYIQEYLPVGEKFENFNQMLTIHLFIMPISAKEAALQKIKELEKRKSTDPLCNYQMAESPDGTESIVDFLVSDSKNDKLNIAEFNVYHFKQVDVGNNQKAIMIYAYSKRSYGDSITDFLSGLKEDRNHYLNTMIGTDIPKVSLSN